MVFRHQYTAHKEISGQTPGRYEKQDQSHALFARQTPPPLGNQILTVVRLFVQLLAGVFHIQRSQVSGSKDNIQKHALGYIVMKKLL
jgi:hypothetical protein